MVTKRCQGGCAPVIRHPVGVTVSGIILVPQTVIRRLARRYGMKGGEDGLLGLACGVPVAGMRWHPAMAERQPERHTAEWKTQDIPSYLLTDSQGMGTTDRPDGNKGRATYQAMRPAGVLRLEVAGLAVHASGNRATICRCKILLLPKQGLSGIAYDGCRGLTPTRSRTRSYSLSLMPSGMSWSNGGTGYCVAPTTVTKPCLWHSRESG